MYSRCEKAVRLALIVILALVLFPALLFGAQAVTGRPGKADLKASVNFSEIVRKAVPDLSQEEEEADKEFLTAPKNRPVPSNSANLWPDLSRIGRQAPLVAMPPPVSPPPSASFAALGDNNTRIPPDVHGAAGPSHLMTTLNSQVRIQDRTGGVISTVSLNSFWSSLSSPSAFDPKILYDPYSNCWMFTSCSNARTSSSSVLMGVTQTSDPTGTWNLYRIDADPANRVWADYPSFGFNKNWIVVQMNMFTVVGDTFIRSNIYAFNKADLYASGSGLFTLMTDTTGGFSQAPAITYDTTLSTMYMVEDWFGNSGGNGILRISTITGSAGSEVYTPDVSFPTVADPWEDVGSTGFTDFAPQSGSVEKIMCDDARMQNCVYRNGSLWCTHTVFLPAGSGTHSAVQWWKLSTAGATLQRGRIEDLSGTIFYAFPSLAINKNEDVLIGHSRFSASQFAGGNYSYRAVADPPNTFETDTVLKAGEASYYKTFSGTRNRWGDYTGTVVDPVNDVDFWTIQQYAATPSGGTDRWGTWWGKVVPPVDPCSPDTVKPSVSCPANIVKANDPGQCNAVVTYSASASDNCPGVSLSCTPSSGSTFAFGVTNVKCIATDASGKKDSCQFTVTVNDTEKPTVSCPPNIVANNDPGQCSAVFNYFTIVSDNCLGVSLSCTPSSGSTFPVGVTNVKCIATDASGNKDSCTFTITVNDTQKPSVSCPANFSLAASPGQCEALVTYNATASDNCPGVSLSCIPPSGILFHVGVTTVNCVATDASGNKDSCQFTVTMNDTEKPVVNCSSNITVNAAPGQCTAAISYSASAADNCGPPITPALVFSCSPPSGSLFAVGITNVKCVATDAAGNKDSCTFTVTVNDTQKPTITCPSNITAYRSASQCDSVPVSFSATVNDNCPGVIKTCTPASGSNFPLGVTTVICVATDASGNRDSCSFTVRVSKGDMDGDGNLTSADVVLMLNCAFLGLGTCDPCFADLDCDGVLTATDVVIELNLVFLGVLTNCTP